MIKSVELHNFTSYEHETIEFELVTLIRGRNGHGKSNILEALRIALFNEDFPVTLIRNGQKEAVITITFVDGRVLKRVRNTKGSSVTAWDSEGKKVLDYTTVSGVTEQVQDFTGFRPVKLDINGKAENLQYVPPKAPQFLQDRSPEVTMRCLSALLSGQGIEVAKTLINKDVTALDSEINAHQKRLNESQSVLDYLNRSIWEEFETRLNEIKEREQTAADLCVRISNLEEATGKGRIDPELAAEIRGGLGYCEDDLAERFLEQAHVAAHIDKLVRYKNMKTEGTKLLREARATLKQAQADFDAVQISTEPCKTCNKLVLCGACVND